MSLRRFQFVLIAVISLSLACGEVEHAPQDVEPISRTEDGSCSDLAHALARWQGREFETCGSQRFRAFTTLGDGLLLGWTPASGEWDVWRLGADDSFGPDPVAANAWSFRNNHVLTAINSERVLVFNHKTDRAAVWSLNAAVRGSQDPLTTFADDQGWPPYLGGRSVLSLDTNHLLDLQPGTGTYSVARYRDGDAGAPFERFEDLGAEEHFRRGHRLVALGDNQLLEWEPRSQAYRIWAYDLERLPADVLDHDPRASGHWPFLGAQHELLVLAPGKMGIWDRDAGTIEVRPFEPLAPDPLANPASNTTQDDRLRSLLPGDEKKTLSNIRRLVILFRQGRAFDTYFGRYCQALAGSEPSCEDGPDCCEGIPELVDGASCKPLDPANDSYVPDDSGPCQVAKLAAWAEGRLSTESTVAECNQQNVDEEINADFTCAGTGAEAGPVGAYHALAQQGALADRYFASAAAEGFVNLLYFAVTRFLLVSPDSNVPAMTTLLAEAHVPYALYVSSLAEIGGQPPPDYYDGSWGLFRGVEELAYDLEHEQLPAVSVVIPALGDADESPGALSSGIEFATNLAGALAESPRYGSETLLIIVHLTSGGFYDHVAPPALPEPDAAGLSYGARVPFLALGPFVRQNQVSHTTLEHASLAKFIQWNWLDGNTGQLGGRDRFVNNLGSLLDARKTGGVVP